MFNPGNVTGGETSVMTDDKIIFTTIKVHLFMINNKDNHDHA